MRLFALAFALVAAIAVLLASFSATAAEDSEILLEVSEHIADDGGARFDRGLMATFGTPERSGRDAGNALAAVTDMVSSVQSWNAERQARGEPLLRIGIGAHYG